MSLPLPRLVTAQRRPHFRRERPPAVRLTEDDLGILRHVAKHRFLRSTHLVRLMARPPKKIIERLGALYHTGHLDRPRAQLDYFATAGSSPMVYGLGNRGAHVLAELDGVTAAKVDWTDKNRDAGRVFIDHTLAIADVMIGFEVAVRGRTDVAVMELGMNHAGEIRTLVGVATPEVRVWTNVGEAHIGYFGSADAIADDRDRKSVV